MKNLVLEAGKYTPQIVLNADEKKYLFSGNSFPVDPLLFYKPIMDWFTKFLITYNSKDEVVINFDFNYINTSSSKQISSLFWLFETSPLKEKIVINWIYDDSENDMLEVGERYKHYLGLKFRFTEKLNQINAF